MATRQAMKSGARHLDAAALDASLAAIASAVAVHRCDAGEGGDLMAIDGAEFGQFDDQRARDDITDAGDALEQILFGAEQRARASISLSMARSIRARSASRLRRMVLNER